MDKLSKIYKDLDKLIRVLVRYSTTVYLHQKIKIEKIEYKILEDESCV